MSRVQAAVFVFISRKYDRKIFGNLGNDTNESLWQIKFDILILSIKPPKIKPEVGNFLKKSPTIKLVPFL